MVPKFNNPILYIISRLRVPVPYSHGSRSRIVPRVAVPFTPVFVALLYAKHAEFCINVVCGRKTESLACPKHGGKKIACSLVCYREWKSGLKSEIDGQCQ
eukprot:2320940-Rhodomonas_salina.1